MSIIDNEATIRLIAFAGGLLLLLLAEVRWPRRAVVRSGRWFNNLVLAVLNTALLRLAFPILAVGWALQVEARDWGLLLAVEMPGWMRITVAVILLDMAIYWQHRILHMLPWLWRLHRMHHSDLDFDVTTGIRFHPGEILVSMLIKLAVITLLGAPALAVLIFEIILSSASLFQHSNLSLPARWDRWLRLLIVTPDMHRVHHSVYAWEFNRNFGFSLSLWDRLFRSYRAQPRDGHLGMRIGLERFRGPQEQRLDQLLWQPLRSLESTGTRQAYD